MKSIADSVFELARTISHRTPDFQKRRGPGKMAGNGDGDTHSDEGRARFDVTANPTTVAKNSTSALSASATGGTGAVAYAVSGGSTISGSTFTATSSGGTVTITATKGRS